MTISTFGGFDLSQVKEWPIALSSTVVVMNALVHFYMSWTHLHDYAEWIKVDKFFWVGHHLFSSTGSWIQLHPTFTVEALSGLELLQ